MLPGAGILLQPRPCSPASRCGATAGGRRIDRIALVASTVAAPLFVSGLAPTCVVYMLSTELIRSRPGSSSCRRCTLWQDGTRFEVPSCLLPGLDLQLPDRRDHRPLPVGRAQQRHHPRSFFVLAHSTTRSWRAVFTFFAAIYYWVHEDVRAACSPAPGPLPSG